MDHYLIYFLTQTREDNLNNYQMTEGLFSLFTFQIPKAIIIDFIFKFSTFYFYSLK